MLGFGFVTVVLLVGVMGGWAALASIEGAVIVGGAIVQEGKNKSVQHDENGVVEKIHVTEGQLVQSGQLLVTLDGTRIHAEREVLRKRLFEMHLKQQRLMATRDGKLDFSLPASLALESGARKELRSLVDVQLNLFRTVSKRQKNREKQLEERIGYLQQEINSMKAQISSENREISILRKESKGLKSLKRRGLVGQQRYNRIRREQTESDGEISRLQAAIAKIKGQMAEARLQIIESRENLRNETLKELELAEGNIIDLEEKLITANHRLKRLQIKSPNTGYVHELQLRTVGGVIRAGDIIMNIVLQSKRLIVEAKVPPRDIDQVKIGSNGTIRFSAFNQRTTPTVKGVVTFISPDQSLEERTREIYFTTRLAIDPAEAEKLKNLKLIPGMPAEIMIKTNARTVISFLTKPLSDQINRAFREE